MNLKKFFIRLTTAFLVFFIAGCSSTTDKSNTSTTSQDSEVTIYFARHGKTMLNTVDRSQGWIDAPLTPAGIEIAEYLGKGMKEADITFDKVYTSTSGRAMETADLILANNGQEGMDYTTDKRLREFNFGTYEGMMNEEMWEVVATAQGRTLDEFISGMSKDGFYKSIQDFADTLSKLDKENVEEGVNWPAEDSATIIARLTESLYDIVADAEKEGHKNVLVVSHGMSIITLLGELDANTELPATGLKNASISTVTYKDGKYSIETVNDMTYVENGQSK